MASSPGVANSTIATDQEKFLASELIARSWYNLVSRSICDPVEQPDGTGITANFVRYERINVPVTTLTEGVTPTGNTLSVTSVTVTLDQWGDFITLSDVAQLTAKHDSLQQAVNALADSAVRVIDREVQLVWLAGTNVQYGDASVTSRSTITAAMTISQSIMQKAYVTLVNAGTPPKKGPSGTTMYKVKDAMASSNINGGDAYVAITDPNVLADIRAINSNFGTWVAKQTYTDVDNLYNNEVGTWLGIRWVETNFIPVFTMFGNTTTAVSSGSAFGTGTPTVTAGAGGSGTLAQATTYNWKVTSKSLITGFETGISLEHTMSTTGAGGATQFFTFAFPASPTNVVYNVYFGSTTGDANLKLAFSNVAAGQTVTVNAVPTSTITAPPNVNTTGTPAIHVVYIHGAESTSFVSLQNLKTYMTPAGATLYDPLAQQRAVGYKYMGKAMIRDQLRILRLELASSF